MRDIKDYISESINEGLNDTLDIIKILSNCKDAVEFEQELLRVLPVKNKRKCQKALEDIRFKFKNREYPGFYTDPQDTKISVNNLASTYDSIIKKDGDVKKTARIIAATIENL